MLFSIYVNKNRSPTLPYEKFMTESRPNEGIRKHIVAKETYYDHHDRL